MRTPLFLKNKVERAIREKGSTYTFTQVESDEYNQPIDGSSSIEIQGLYHEQNSFITVSSFDAASVQRKKSPMILTLFDDNVRLIKQGDHVYINSKKYTVSGVLDIQNYGVVADISLEMEV